MDLGINPAPPKVMHIDLNSAFAMIEQQANPLLRGRPVGMVNRAVPGGTIIAASYEAKALGVGVGTKVKEAKFLAPGIVILETDPPKYVRAHQAFERIITSYAPSAHMKSIDEGVIDFNNVYLKDDDLRAIAYEIKARLKDELGEWITCNIGIAPNRWLAKLAAGLHKPDGLDVINSRNLLTTLAGLKLMDLSGINHRYALRLRLAGIMTPLDFLAASGQKLRREVFHGINGHYWYLRLRGWEVDTLAPTTKTIGRQYVMHEFTSDITKLEPIILKLCERLGRRLRAGGFCAYGLQVGCSLARSETGRPGAAVDSLMARRSHSGWHNRQKFAGSFYTTQEIFERAMRLFAARPAGAIVKTLFITTYGLSPAHSPQLPLFETSKDIAWGLMQTVDNINNRFGEMVVTPAAMSGTQAYVADKIPFNNIRYLSQQK